MENIIIPEKKIEYLKKEFEELSKSIYDPAKMQNQREYKKLSKRYKTLQEILDTYNKLKKSLSELSESKEMLKTEKDAEFKDMIEDEIESLEKQIKPLYERLKDLLAPKDPNDDKNAIIEIRAGTGGEEAALFVADLYRMYSYYADKKGFKKSLISSNPTGVGGYKEIIFSLSGDNVYGTMRFESGVHRVQRIPVTESQGRIHTSAVTVAVLPEVDEDVEIELNDKDLRIDVFRATGHGGQSVNTTDSAVRITHLPTGLVVTCQDEKSQIKNKAKALKVLKSRLYDMELAKKEAEIAKSRKAQVGTGDRSAKIRTYNFPQSRVTDHRINMTSYKLNDILMGELDEFIEALKIAYRNERVEN